MKQFNFLLKQIWPLGVILMIWLIFSSPYFLHGKAPFPGDNQQYNFSPWDSYAVKGPIKNPAMTDVIVQMYPWKHFTIDSLKKGFIPFWNPYSFSGTTHLANYQSTVLSPFNLLFFIFPFVDAWSLLILFQPLLAGLFMYLFVRGLKVSQRGALISTIGFMFCGFMTVWMSWGTLGYAILFLPLALFAIEKFYSAKQNFLYLILLSISVILSFLSGHFQTSLYFLIFVLVYIFYKWLVSKNMLNTYFLILYTFFGLLIAMPQILPSLQVYSQSLRSTLFQKGEAIPWTYLPTLLAPDIFGNPVTRNDWLGHYAEWNGYIGLLPFLLAVYSIIKLKRKKPQTLYLLITGLISLILSLSLPILDTLVTFHVPVLSTSAASRIIVLFSFSFLVLAGMGFDQLVMDLKNKKLKALVILFSVFSVIFAVLWLMVLGKLFLLIDKIVIMKQNLVLPTILFICFFVIIALFRFVKSGVRNENVKYIIGILLVLLVSIDLLRFATKWMPFVDKQQVFTPTNLTSSFHPDPAYERVLGNYGSEMSVYFGLPSVDGYDAVYLKRYGEFVYYVNHGTLGESEKSLVVLSKTAPLTERAMDLLNVRYVIHKISDGRAPWIFPFWSFPAGQFDIVYKDNNYEVYRNNVALPRAFLVGSYIVKQDPKGVLDTLFADNFAQRRAIALEEDPHIAPAIGDVGTAKIVTYTPNKVTIETNAKADELLFMSDAYYPDWEAKVDGSLTKIYRADYAFRAVKVPAGKYTVMFEYNDRTFVWGVWIAIIGITGMIVSFISFSKMRVR